MTSPASWNRVSLLEVCELIRGVSYSAGEAVRNPTDGYVPLLRANNISGSLVFDDLQFVPPARVASQQRLRKGDSVIAMSSGSKSVVGKAATLRAAWDGTFGAFCGVLRPRDALDGAYLGYFLQTSGYRNAISEAAAGVNINNLKRDHLAKIEIPLPPLEEQRRIAAKLDDLLGRVAATRERLDRVPAILRRFRQSVLAAAVSGRLGNQNAENMPPDWCSASIEELCELIIDCPHATPKWAEFGEICLRTTNFLPGRLDLREVRYVSPETYAERVRRGQPRADDVLYSREGGILGIACIFPSGLRACLGQRMMLLRTRPERILPRYLMHVLNSPSISGVVRELTIGSASPHINVGDVRRFKVPLPSLRQQRAIVELVDNLFSLAGAAEQRHAAAAAGSERTTESILARAFNGGL